MSAAPLAIAFAAFAFVYFTNFRQWVHREP